MDNNTMLSRSSTLLKSVLTKNIQSPRKPSTPNSLYSGIQSAQRAIQQQQQRILQSRRSNQSKRGSERTNLNIAEICKLPIDYHPWEVEYHKLNIREKNIKSMTKDPYTPIRHLISHAVENITTEIECCPTLIPAKAVKIETFNIQEAPRPSLPTIVRYLRRNELLPSERPVPPLTQIKIPLSSQSQYRRPTISVVNNSRITGTAPTLVTNDRLLNRAKIRIDSSSIRRPPRKVVVNTSHETIIPLSVYG